MKKFLQEFKDFAMRGSVIDLAVGVIIGGAFQKIVNSLVKDILSPILGLFAKNSFDDLSISFMGVATTTSYLSANKRSASSSPHL